MKRTLNRIALALSLTSGFAHAQHGMHDGMAMPMTNLTPLAKEMGLAMQKMSRDMAAAPMTGDPDHDFAAMMVPHHQGAVDMAKSELLYGKDPVMRRLAQEILVTQEQEIILMRRRLAQLAKPVKANVGARPERFAPKAGKGDRVYTADQISNTVSVIDPATNKLLGAIHLGDPVPAALSPLYKGELLVHGLGFSPDGRTLDVISIGSNSVTLIDTATNRVKGRVYVGRSPHEGFFTPDGKELWVVVRGEDYVSVIDPVKVREIRRIHTANGPGMVLFRPDGKYAFVPSSFVPECDVIDVKTHQVVARVKQASPFSPNLAVSRDGKEVWFTLKDSGKTQVLTTAPPFRIVSTLNTGPITNHVTLADNANGKFAYVTVGGENVVKVYRRGPKPTLVKTIPTGDLPHGVWGSPDGTKVYVGLENGGAVEAIDALTNRVVATIPVGQLPQALVYVPNAVRQGDGRQNLQPLGQASQAVHVELQPVDGSGAAGNVVVNSLGLVDSLQVAAKGLQPGKEYELQLVASPTAPYGERTPLVKFKANVAGAGLAQTVGPVRRAVTSAADSGPDRRYLLLTETASGRVVLAQP